MPVLKTNAKTTVPEISGIHKYDARLIECGLNAGECAQPRIGRPALQVFDRDLRDPRCLSEIGLRPTNERTRCADLGPRNHPSNLALEPSDSNSLMYF